MCNITCNVKTKNDKRKLGRYSKSCTYPQVSVSKEEQTRLCCLIVHPELHVSVSERAGPHPQNKNIT